MKLNRSVLILTGDNTVIQQEPIRGTIIIVVTVIKCNVIRKPGNREDLQPDVYKVQQHKWNLIKPDRWLYVLTANKAAICLTFGIQTHMCLYCLIPSDTVQISNIHYFWKKKLLCIITKSVGMHTLPFPLMFGLCFFQVGVCPFFYLVQSGLKVESLQVISRLLGSKTRLFQCYQQKINTPNQSIYLPC